MAYWVPLTRATGDAKLKEVKLLIDVGIIVISTGKEENGRMRIQIPTTHEDIANSIAMTRETASREIEHLQKKGLLSKKDNHHFFITDIVKLQEELENLSDKKYL